MGLSSVNSIGLEFKCVMSELMEDAKSKEDLYMLDTLEKMQRLWTVKFEENVPIEDFIKNIINK